jgi:hypothetical protein
MIRALRSAALVVALTAGLTGCLSIKQQTATQRAPGVVTLAAVICASDYNQSRPAASCHPGNVAEQDSARADAESSGLGQLLVGFRVPLGTGAPDSFTSDAQDATFSRSATYTQELARLVPPPAGQQWVGYISTAKTFNPSVAADQQTGFRPEFTLPPQSGGEPFRGPLPWRLVAGFRPLNNVGEAGNPVTCTGFNFCIDSPQNPATSLSNPVSDFGVLPAAGVTAPQTTTATVSFPVRYLDGGGLGAQQLALTATTDVPGTRATVAPTLSAAPGSTSNADVAVPVPLGTPPGSYNVTLSAGTGSPAVTRTSTATLVVTPPPDADADGLADPFDKCPSVARGGFDRDGDGCVGPYRRIRVSTGSSFEVTSRGLLVGSLRLKGLPAGARVRLSSPALRARQTLTARRSTLNVRGLRGKLLKRGEGLTATVTRLGFVGERFAVKVKRYGNTRAEFRRIARRPFTATRRCIPVGETAPARRCSTTPPTGP